MADKAERLANKKKWREEMAALDALQARLNVRRAENLRLVESWFPKPPEGTTTEEPVEDLTANAVPPRLGLGAPLPKEWTEKGDFYEKEKLRKTLLVKRPRPDNDERREPKKHKSGGPVQKDESSDEEEVGRSALGKSKKAPAVPQKREAEPDSDEDDGPGRGWSKTDAGKASSGSFFDMHKSSKKKKKKNKKHSAEKAS